MIVNGIHQIDNIHTIRAKELGGDRWELEFHPLRTSWGVATLTPSGAVLMEIEVSTAELRRMLSVAAHLFGGSADHLCRKVGLLGESGA